MYTSYVLNAIHSSVQYIPDFIPMDKWQKVVEKIDIKPSASKYEQLEKELDLANLIKMHNKSMN